MDETYASEQCRGTPRRYRRRLAFLLAAFFCCAVAVQPAQAVQTAAKAESTASIAARSVIPVGHTVGIKLFSDGLLVVNLSESTDGAGNVCPARSCGIKTGDLLLEMDLDKIAAALHPAVVITVITNTDDFASVEGVASGTVEPGADLLKISK